MDRLQHLMAFARAGGGVLIVDDTGLPKTGDASMGVAWVGRTRAHEPGGQLPDAGDHA